MMRSVVVSICDSLSGAFDQQDDADQRSQTVVPCCTISTSTKIAITPPASRISCPKPDQGEPPMTMQNDQNRRPGFLESASGQVIIVAIIVVVFVSMVLHLL
jgi:hypothetical protein